MFGNGKNADERTKGKDKKKGTTRKYGQPKYKQARRGILSCWCSALAISDLAGCVAYAFWMRGNAAGIVGGLAVLAFALAVFGINYAVNGFKERERNYLSCKIGIGMAIFVILLFLAIFVGGLGL